MKYRLEAGNLLAMAPETPIGTERQFLGDVMIDYPSYRGFGWNHLLMLRWRERHLIPLGIGSILEDARIVFMIGISLLCFVCAVMGVFTDRRRAFFWIGGAWLVALITGQVITWIATNKLRRLSHADRFDWLLASIIKEHRLINDSDLSQEHIVKRMTTIDGWEWYMDMLPDILIKLAKKVLQAEKDYPARSGPVFAASPVREAKERFEATYATMEELGLVQGGYEKYFKRAKKEEEIAEEIGRQFRHRL